MKNFVRKKRVFLIFLIVFVFFAATIAQTPEEAAECAQEMVAHYIGNVATARMSGEIWVAESVKQPLLIPFRELIGLVRGGNYNFLISFPAFISFNEEGIVL